MKSAKPFLPALSTGVYTDQSKLDMTFVIDVVRADFDAAHSVSVRCLDLSHSINAHCHRRGCTYFCCSRFGGVVQVKDVIWTAPVRRERIDPVGHIRLVVPPARVLQRSGHVDAISRDEGIYLREQDAADA